MLRLMIAERLGSLRVAIDEAPHGSLYPGFDCANIGASDASVWLVVVEADENHSIVREVRNAIKAMVHTGIQG